MPPTVRECAGTVKLNSTRARAREGRSIIENRWNEAAATRKR